MANYERFCCFIPDQATGEGCKNKPQWVIEATNAHPSEATDSCTEHVGQMLSDAFEHHIYQIEE